MLHEWLWLISDVENESGKVDMESAKVHIDSVKLEKEEMARVANFSDIETDDEACWFQNGVDLRGYSQVEDDDFNEQVTD